MLQIDVCIRYFQPFILQRLSGSTCIDLCLDAVASRNFLMTSVSLGVCILKDNMFALNRTEWEFVECP